MATIKMPKTKSLYFKRELELEKEEKKRMHRLRDTRTIKGPFTF